MYIDGFGKAVQREIEDRINDATKYNSGIFKLTELYEQGGHGDIIKYLEENKLNTDELQDVLLYFIQGLNKEDIWNLK